MVAHRDTGGTTQRNVTAGSGADLGLQRLSAGAGRTHLGCSFLGPRRQGNRSTLASWAAHSSSSLSQSRLFARLLQGAQVQVLVVGVVADGGQGGADLGLGDQGVGVFAQVVSSDSDSSRSASR